MDIKFWCMRDYDIIHVYDPNWGAWDASCLLTACLVDPWPTLIIGLRYIILCMITHLSDSRQLICLWLLGDGQLKINVPPGLYCMRDIVLHCYCIHTSDKKLVTCEVWHTIKAVHDYHYALRLVVWVSHNNNAILHNKFNNTTMP